MTGRGHALVGIGVGLVAFSLLRVTAPSGLAFLGLVGTILGSTAPDWLEFPSRPGFFSAGGKRLIPHRTLTHWWPLWVWLFTSALQMQGAFLPPLLTGFALGGLSHLLVDLPNPMGVPLWLPFASSRVSLHWWRSGQHEALIVAGFFAFGLVSLRLVGGF